MWFAKLWRGSKDDEQDDEPARHPRAPVAQEAPRAAVASKVRAATNPVNPAAKKGFDPYNSGAFKRHNAWERVGRR